MKLTPMRYKTYVWPHNPKIYGITYERQVAVNRIPFGDYVMQDMGRSYRVLRGEGEFAGQGAYDEFKKLASVFYLSGPGLLIHPVWQSSNAYFVSLSLKQEPSENYVSYTFEFWEGCDKYAQGAEKIQASDRSSGQSAGTAAQEQRYHTVSKGETMWGIAKKYGMDLSQLIAKNPQVKNPNLIYTGQKLYI